MKELEAMMAKWRPVDSTDYFLSIASKNSGPGYIVDRRWLRNVNNKLCVCRLPKRKVYPNPVDVILGKIPTNTTIEWADSTGPLIIASLLMEMLRPFLHSGVIGQCWLQPADKGPAVPTKYVTYYDSIDNMVQVFGDPDMEVNRCPECDGRASAFKGNLYVRRNDVQDRMVFMEGVNIYIHRTLDATIDWTQFPDIEKYRVYVRDVL